jgi:hypothetical protein
MSYASSTLDAGRHGDALALGDGVTESVCDCDCDCDGDGVGDGDRDVVGAQ